MFNQSVTVTKMKQTQKSNKMAKDKKSLMEMALAATIKNTVKGRGTSGKKTYLDRFVGVLLKDGTPTEPKVRKLIIAEISLEIALEQRTEEIAIDSTTPEFALTEAGDTEDDATFKVINNKVKAQVAAAVSDCQNSTSLSYNEKYKNDWLVSKGEGGTVQLVAKEK